MPVNSTNQFISSLSDVFALFGVFESKRMFSGHGLFHQGLMFALVVDDELYLKADNTSSAKFTERGLEAFTYKRGEKEIALSYYMAPEELFDD